MTWPGQSCSVASCRGNCSALKTMEGELVEGIHITLATDVLREFYDGMAKDAEREATIGDAVMLEMAKRADDCSPLIRSITEKIGDTRAAQARTRAAAWRFLRDHTPTGGTLLVKPQELLDLGIRIAKGG